MKPQESRPRVGVIISVPTSVLLVVLFFMPWLTISCDPSALMEMGQMPGAAELPPIPAEFTKQAEIAEASGLQLAAGEVTPVGLCKTAPSASSADQGLPSRWWVYAGLVLPAALLAVCTLCLTGKTAAPAAGKLMFFLAFAGVGMMYMVSRISYVDDIVDKARSEFARHAPPGMGANAAVDQAMDQTAEQLDKCIITRPAPMLWVTMGAYGMVCICALATIGSPTPASQKAIAERMARSRRQSFMPSAPASRPSYRERRSSASGSLPQFGPDLFAPSDSGESGSPGTNRTG